MPLVTGRGRDPCWLGCSNLACRRRCPARSAGQGTRPGEQATHRPAATTTTAARLVWLAIAAALGRWLTERVLSPQMGLEGLGWMALLPALLAAAAGLAMAAQGLLRRRGWARWAAVVACSLLGVTALAGLADWTGALVRSRAQAGLPVQQAAAGRHQRPIEEQ